MHTSFSHFGTQLTGWDHFWLGGYTGMFIGLLLIAAVIYLLFRKNHHHQETGSSSYESAESVLKRRFVNGEIDRDEYVEKMEILQNS